MSGVRTKDTYNRVCRGLDKMISPGWAYGPRRARTRPLYEPVMPTRDETMMIQIRNRLDLISPFEIIRLASFFNIVPFVKEARFTGGKGCGNGCSDRMGF